MAKDRKPSPATAGLPPKPAVIPEAAIPEIVVAAPAWRRLVPRAEALARRAAAAGITLGGTDAIGMGAISVVLADDRAVRRLNARHRGRDKPTNVLSFPDRGGGGLILALGVVLREAGAAGKRPGHHLAHLVVHGVLHLAGHDHHHPGDARRMEMAEARILRRLGLPNPWRRA